VAPYVIMYIHIHTPTPPHISLYPYPSHGYTCPLSLPLFLRFLTTPPILLHVPTPLNIILIIHTFKHCHKCMFTSCTPHPRYVLPMHSCLSPTIGALDQGGPNTRRLARSTRERIRTHRGAVGPRHCRPVGHLFLVVKSRLQAHLREEDEHSRVQATYSQGHGIPSPT
jgi:hypothetical protein